MGNFVDWLVKTGKLTPEEAGEREGRNLRPSGNNRDLITELHREQGRDRQIGRKKQADLFEDRWPLLRAGGYSPNSSSKTDYKPLPKWTSAGGVVVKALTPELIDYVYVVKPAGNFYGKLTFPKGRIDDGETQEVAAIREVSEEAGVLARPVPDGYLGEFSGSMSMTHYYLMYWVKDSVLGHDREMEQVMLVHVREAHEMFERVHNYRDRDVLKAARMKIEQIKANLLKQP